MKSNRINRSLINASGVLALALLGGQAALADSLIWGGQSLTSANWSDSANWTNSALANAVPAVGDDLIFNSVQQAFSSNDIAGLSVASITFTNGGFDFTGLPLGISNGITNTTFSGTELFDLALTLGAAQTFEADASTLTFDYPITNNGNALTITGSGDVSLLGQLSGAGSLTMAGSGTLLVTNHQPLTGGIFVNSGTLNVAPLGNLDFGGALTPSLITVNAGGKVYNSTYHAIGGGTAIFINGGTWDLDDEDYKQNLKMVDGLIEPGPNPNSGGGQLRVGLAGGNGSYTWYITNSVAGSTISNPLNTIGSGVTLTLDVARGAAASDLTISGVILGSGNIIFARNGVTTLSGYNTHSGNLTINNGSTVKLTGALPSSTITVASNAVFDISGTSFTLNTNQTLQGVGTVIGTLNDYNAVTGAVLSPGGNNAAGTLTMDGLSLGGNLTLNFDLANSVAIGGGTNDLLIVTNFSANAGVTNTVNISFLNGTPVVGTAYTLIKYGNGFTGDPSQFLTAAASRYVYTFVNNTTIGAIQVVVTGTPGNLVWKGDGVTNAWDVSTTTNWLNGANKDVFLQGDNATFSDVGSNTPNVTITATVQPTTVTVNATKNYTIGGSGKISAGAKLFKSNSGNLVLLTGNDFTGGGSLNGSGAVIVGNGGSAGALGSGNLTNNTAVTFFQNASSTYAGNMSGTGSVTAFVPGATLSLTGTNTFTGGLTVANGTVQIGSNPAIAGATVAGTITNYSALYYSRSDAFTNINTVTSAGNTREYGNGDVYIRGAGGMTVNGTAPISAGGNLNVGATLYGKLTLNSNANVTVANTMNIGDSSGIGGDVFQNAGTVNVNGYGTVKILSIGLWGSEISSYNMYGGILNVPNATIDVGSDGIGLLNITNGTINCNGLSIDNNGATAAYGGTNSVLTMAGGQLNIGVNGISGNTATNALTPTVILSGGTIGTLAPAGWTTAFNLRLTNGTPTIDTSNAVVAISGSLSGNGGLNKQGVGYLNLNGANTFTNVTTVIAGTLQGSGTNVGPIVVQSGASLSAGSNFTTGTLTVSNVTMNTGATLLIDASSTAATSDLIYAKGALTLDTATPVVFNFLGGTPYTGGPYTVVSNLLTRTGHLVVSSTGLTRYTSTVIETNASNIQVAFTGTNASLVWNGGTSTNWNINTDPNWLNAGVADKFYQSDAVLFDDTGIAKSNINVSATVTPAKVTVDTAGTYTLTGSPISGLGSLVKSGTGKLTLANSNNFTGGTTIAGGTLQVGNGGTSGYILGTVNDYGNVTFNESGNVNFNGTLNGPGTLTQAGSGTLVITATQNHYGGTTINPGATVQLGNGPTADAGSLGNGIVTNNGTVIFNRGANVSVAAPYTGNGAFTFLGTGYGGQSGYILNATNTFTGPVSLSLARIQSGAGAQSFGSPSSISVSAGSQVYATATPASPVYNMPLILSGSGWADGLGALRIENIGNWAGNITLAANARIGVNNATTNTISGNISGNYELETYGGNAAAGLVLAPSATNTYSALRVSIGTAGAKTIVGNNAAVPNNVQLTMNGGTLWMNGFAKSFNPYLNVSTSSSIQNGNAATAGNVTLNPPVNIASTVGTFADSGAPLNVTVNQSGTLAAFAVSSASASWTGNFTNNGGTVNITAANQLGSPSVATRTLAFNNSTLNISPNNGWSGGGATATMGFNNSTVNCTRFNAFGPLVLNGSTLTGTNTSDSAYYATYNLSGGKVTVLGSTPSLMTGFPVGNNDAGFNLQTPTVFNVADVTASPAVDLTVSAPLRTGGAIGGVGSLIKTGAGTMLVDATATYTGSTVISNGVLALSVNGSIATSPSIVVNAGATLDVSALGGGFALAANQTLAGSGTVSGGMSDGSATVITPGTAGTAGTLTVTTNLTFTGNGSLAIDLAATTTTGAGVNDLIQVNGNLNLSTGTPTPVTFNFLGGAPATGTSYTLIQCTGTVTGTAATAFTNALNSRYTAAFSQVGNNVVVTFSGSASNLVWTGTDPLVASTWDVATSTNWNNGAGPDIFFANDTVRFDNTSVNTNVTLNVTVNPGAVTVDSTNNYAITGTGTIAGNTGLTKNNTNTLTLGVASSFTGPIAVNAGVFALGNNSALPQNANVTVANGAQIDFAGQGNSTTRNYSFTIAGSGPDGNGAIKNSSGTAIYGNASVASVTLTGNTTIGDSGRWDVGSGQAGTILNGNGYNLTVKNGSGGMSMRPQVITNLASLTLTNGLMWYEGFSQTNAWTATTTNYIMPGASLGIYGGLAVSMPIVLTNATILNQGSGTPTWLSPITLQGTNVFNAGAAQNFLGVISGPGAIAVGGFNTTTGAIPATLIFSNANTFAGGVTLSNAPVTIGHTTAVGGYAAIVLTSSNGLGSGPINLALTMVNTNTATNTVRALECNIQNGGVVPNAIVLPAATTTVTNMSIQGHDSTSVFTLAGQITGGYAGLTNWVDFGDSGSSGVLRLACNTNTFTSAIYVDRGVLALTGDGCLGNSANTLFLDNASANGGLRFDATGITIAHNIIWNTSSTISVYGDNDGDGVPEVANNVTISGNIAGITAGQGLVVGGGTNIAGTSYGTLTLTGSNTYNSQITINPNTKLVAGSTNALGATGYYGIVASGGTLSLGNVGAFVNRQIQFSGPGVQVGGVGVGALENLAGTNVYSAPLSMNAASSFGVTVGSLTLSAGISGAYPLTKVGPGPLILSATETYTAGTYVNAGTLILNGSLPVGNFVNVAYGTTLGGSGTFNCPVSVQYGGTFQPGAGGSTVGKCLVNGPLNLGGNTVMFLNKATPTNSQVAGISTVIYGGTLSVTNLGGTFLAGDKFTLFSATSRQGVFTTLNLPTLPAGLGWSNSLAIDGSIQVVNAVNTAPPVMTNSYNAGTLTLSWPSDHLGWRLQVQTNALTTGITTNWLTWPNSTNLTSVSVQVDPTQPTVFFRLVYP